MNRNLYKTRAQALKEMLGKSLIWIKSGPLSAPAAANNGVSHWHSWIRAKHGLVGSSDKGQILLNSSLEAVSAQPAFLKQLSTPSDPV